jgi:hypothetical protein
MPDQSDDQVLHKRSDVPGPATMPLSIKRYNTGDEVVRPAVNYAGQSIYSGYLTLYIQLFRQAHEDGAAGIKLEDVPPTRGIVVMWDGERYMCIGCGDWGGNLTFISKREYMEASQVLMRAYELDDVDYLEELGSRPGFADHLLKSATIGPASVALECGLYL